jgi:hypothetical protein
MKTVSFVIERHNLIIDTYPFYKCTCGYEATILIGPNKITEEVTKEPSNPIEYLDCGHAKCCIRMTNDGRFWCTHCNIEK